MKTVKIKNIWIESEEKGAILIGKEITDDNSDVIVTFDDDSEYIATFFTYENINTLMNKNKQTGENLSGAFFWAKDLILIEKIERILILQVINELIQSDGFEQVFSKIED